MLKDRRHYSWSFGTAIAVAWCPQQTLANIKNYQRPFSKSSRLAMSVSRGIHRLTHWAYLQAASLGLYLFVLTSGVSFCLHHLYFVFPSENWNKKSTGKARIALGKSFPAPWKGCNTVNFKFLFPCPTSTGNMHGSQVDNISIDSTPSVWNSLGCLPWVKNDLHRTAPQGSSVGTSAYPSIHWRLLAQNILSMHSSILLRAWCCAPKL